MKRRFVLIGAGLVLLAGFPLQVWCEGPSGADADRMAAAKERMAVMQRIREIENNTIAQDEELKKISDQITALQQQQRELMKQRSKALQQKLAGNQEYQDLQKRLQTLMPSAPPKVTTEGSPKDAVR